jgi:hypothetical protein
VLSRNCLGRRELAAGHGRQFQGSELSGCNSSIQIAADLRVCDVSHTASKAVTNQETLVYNGFALEILIPRKCKRFAGAID